MRHYAYALQPYLLELYGDEDYHRRRGCGGRRRADRRRLGRAAHRRRLLKHDGALFLAGIADGLVLAVLGVAQAFWLGVALVVLWGSLGGRAADPAGLSERDDSVAATRDGALVRLADGVERRVVIQPVLGRTADVYGYGTSLVVAAGLQLLSVPFLVASRRERSPADTATGSMPAAPSRPPPGTIRLAPV